MTGPLPRLRPDQFDEMPKVELHRHLEGSLRLDTLLEVARTHGITIPRNFDLRSMVQMQKHDPLTFTTFLSKFQTLRLFYLSPEIIQRITREAIADAALDRVRYMELRFSPMALSRSQNFALGDVIDWVIESAQQTAADYNITVRLIASVNRHESPDLAEKIADLAVQRRSRGIVGLDLAGNEAEFPSEPFIPIFRAAKAHGLRLCVHAGEWQGADNVLKAIDYFDADRIGHGVRVIENPEVVTMAAQKQTAFEVCITSNYQTGVVPALTDHPITRMLQAGLNVTLNTDDPSISQINLSGEYRLFVEHLGISKTILIERILAAAQATFLPDKEREDLVASLKQELE